MPRCVRIERVEAAGNAYEQVVALGDANSATLGHLPYAVFEEAASAGCLLAARQRGDVIGYALFALRKRRHEVSLTHLCVRDDMRSTGAARGLVEEIVRLYPDRRGIRLRCRTDFAAHQMWPRLGFEEWGHQRGRSRAGHMLAVWWRPIADLSLFDAVALTPGSASEDDLIVAVLDTNVVRDVRDGRDEGASRALLADWVDGHADLVVTAEVTRELLAFDRRAHPGTAIGHKHEFRQLEAADAAVDEVYATLRGASSLSANQDADLRVVAETAVGGATHLITRDERLLHSTDAIESFVGVTVVTPADFLLSILAESTDGFEPRFIKTSGFAIQRRSSVPTKSPPQDKSRGVVSGVWSCRLLLRGCSSTR